MASDEQYVEFVRARTSALLRTACLLTAGDRQAAEDLVQTAVAQGFVKRRRIRDAAAIEAYVRKILVHAAIRHSRESWRHVELKTEPDEQGSGSDGVGGVADRLVVLASLRVLRQGNGRSSFFATTTICRRLRSPQRWAVRRER